jgi:hypothetical protein
MIRIVWGLTATVGDDLEEGPCDRAQRPEAETGDSRNHAPLLEIHVYAEYVRNPESCQRFLHFYAKTIYIDPLS